MSIVAPTPYIALGRGKVGGALIDRLANPDQAAIYGLESEPTVVIRNSGYQDADGSASVITDYTGLVGFDGVVFNALPPSAAAESLEFTEFFLEQGATVISAEKSAWASNRERILALSDGGKRYGDTATVGGGSRLLRVAEVLFDPIQNVSEAHGVFNGTWAALSNMVGPTGGGGRSLGRGVEAVKMQGLAEPDAEGVEPDPVNTVLGEKDDIPKKVNIFTATVMANTVLCPADELPLRVEDMPFQLDRDNIDTVMRTKARDYRAITSFYSLQYHDPIDPKKEGIIGGFDVIRYGFQIVSGFQLFKANPLMHELGNLTGPNNGFVIGAGKSEKYYDSRYIGPGAGPDTTADAMLYDVNRLRRAV